MSHIAESRIGAASQIKTGIRFLLTDSRNRTDPNKRQFQIDLIRANLRVLVRGGRNG